MLLLMFSKLAVSFVSLRVLNQRNCLYFRSVLQGKRTVSSMAHQRMVWIDLEDAWFDWFHHTPSRYQVPSSKINSFSHNSLDVETCQIIEIACLVTDGHLNIIAEGPDLVIHQPDAALDVMDDWCTKHHGESGLTAAVKASRISLQQAENTVLDFVKQHVPPRACPLAGNSIHADKKFLDKYMPHLMDYLHYRIVDVSTIKELCWRWYPRLYSQAPRKKSQHRALEDIKESIHELQFYKNNIFRSNDI